MNKLVIGQTGLIGKALHFGLNTTLSFNPKHWDLENFQYEFEKFSYLDNLYIYWTAGISNNTSSQTQIENEIKLINYFFELNKRKKNIKQLNFISSAGSIYAGSTANYINESTVPNPISIYGQSRLVIEKIFRDYCYQNHIKLNIFRPTNVFGFRDKNKKNSGVINNLINANINKLPMNIFVSLFTKQDYIDVNFVTQNIINISLNNEMCNNGLQNTFILSRNYSHSIQEILTIINRITNSKTPFVMQYDSNADLRNSNLHFRVDNTSHINYKIMPIEFQIRKLIAEYINVKIA
jgi:nucleoside-diphosphate-sugar epimerase